MARKVRDKELDTKQARQRLAARGKPYWRLLEPGLHLGYRRLKGRPGTWVARHYVGEQKYQVESLGPADDLSDADGVAVLSFWDAQRKAREAMVARAKTGQGTTAEAVRVRQAVELYIAARDARDSRRKGRAVRSDASQRLQRYVLGQAARGRQPAREASPLAEVYLHELEDSDLGGWLASLPEGLKFTSKQRLINDLKAALNGHYQSKRKHLPPTLPDTIKHGLKLEADGHDQTIARENQILSDAQVTRLLIAAREIDGEQGWDGDLYRLVTVLAATGARFSQVVRMGVSDYQPKNGRLLVPFSRKGKNRTSGHTAVRVAQDVLDALYPAVVGRKGSEPLLQRWRHRQIAGRVGVWERAERGPWQIASEMPWSEIKERAGMPDAIPYAFRHSSIVRGIRANLPLRLVAALHDTSVKMIELHYSRWIVDGLEELAAKAVVALLPNGEANVLPMRERA
jgi:integrase